jgi:hypothetical protein
MGTVPILDVGCACIPQSKAIERFVARKLGLLGIDPFEEALVDAVCELIRDMEQALEADESRHLISLPHLCMTWHAYSAFLQVYFCRSARGVARHQQIHCSCMRRILRWMLFVSR